MKTEVSGSDERVVIDRSDRVYLVGERINPGGSDSKLANSIAAGDMEFVRQLAREQVENGADLLDVNVDFLEDQVARALPMVVEAVSEETDVPLVIDTNHENTDALEAALEVCPGRPIVNSVNGQDESLDGLLPLVAEHDTAVIGLTLDDDGIPDDPERRLAIAEEILTRAEDAGVAREDVIVDCATLPISTDPAAGTTTLETIELVTERLGNNVTLGVSNVSFQMPRRPQINNTFIAMAIQSGMNVPIANPATAKEPIMIADMLLGRDEFATRYLDYFRSHIES